MGITLVSTEGGTISSSTSSTIQVTYTTSATADTTSKISDIITSVVDMTVTVTQNGTEVGVFTVGVDDTIDDLLTTLAGYGISGTMENGVISFNSPNGAIASGAILDEFGVTTTSSTLTITATTDSKISDVVDIYLPDGDFSTSIKNKI